MYEWPKWERLKPYQIAKFANGIGSAKMHPFVRKVMTFLGNLFFEEASWNHHDYGYFKGGTEADRKRCDRLFYRAMISDAKKNTFFTFPLAFIFATTLYVILIIWGKSAFAYGVQIPPNYIRG